MDLHDLKSRWQQAGAINKTEADLQKMMKVKNHPSLKKIRLRLIIEMVVMTVFSFIYYDGLDGDKKPLFANVLLVTSLMLIVINDIIGYISISKSVKGINIRAGIQNYLIQIKRLSVLSMTFSFIYSVALMIFLTSTIHLTSKRTVILAACIGFLLLSIYFSAKIWSGRIKKLRKLSNELEDQS